MKEYLNVNKESMKISPQISNNKTVSVDYAHPQSSSQPRTILAPTGHLANIL